MLTIVRRAAWRVPAVTLCVMTAALLAAAPRVALAQAPTTVDFDAAMRGLRFDPAKVDANLDGTDAGNGMLDADELALVSAVLAAPSLKPSSAKGVDPAAVRAAFAQARESATSDLRTLLPTYPTAADVVAGYVLLGRGSFDSYDTMSRGFGAPLKGNYALALELGS